MSARRLFRIVLSIVVVVLLWGRLGQEWRDRSALWTAGAVTLSVVLILIVIVDVTGVQQRWRRLRDNVPKKPLGLD
jgi:hypothetical protein